MQLIISNLSKTYPNGVTALNGVSLKISTGMYGLVGPNGAGKSTLMRTLATLQEADSGSVRLDDLDVLKEKDAVRRLLGYLPQEFGLYPKLSAIDMLTHIAILKGVGGHSQRKDLVTSLLQPPLLESLASFHFQWRRWGSADRNARQNSRLRRPKRLR